MKRTCVASGTIIAVLVALFSAVPVSGNTFTVTSTADTGPGSLRDAIASASSGDTISFNVAYPATITFALGTVEINKNLTISGPGPSNLAFSGNNDTTVFVVDPGVTATISGVTVEMGPTALTNSGTLTINNCTFSNNSQVSYGWGGAIVNKGILAISNTTFSGNFAGAGGAIFHYSGTVTITASTFSGNSAGDGGGGAIYINPNAGLVTISNSTFSGNSANTSGAGAIANRSSLTISYSTLSGNSAPRAAGISMEGSTTLKSTILANGSSSGGNCYVSGSVVSGGYNLSDDGSCGFSQTTDLNTTPAGLDPNGLGNHGGPTQTVALLSTSPAVNAVPLSPTGYCTAADGSPVMTDQRGVTRPLDQACDIGAYELEADTDKGLASLLGPNTFTGTQTVNGTVSATSFTGDGSGLTNVTAAHATSADSATAANFATSAGTSTTATNALALGGILATNFARLDAGNSFTGNQSVSGNFSATGSVSGSGANFSGVLTTAGVVVPPLGTATITGTGYNSYPLDLIGSAYRSGMTVSPFFRWQTEGGSCNGTSCADLDLLYGFVGGQLQRTGFQIASNGIISFAPGQTFPGVGTDTITGVTAGTGLSGGGTTGNVSLSVDGTVARTNAANTFSASQTVSGNLTATSFTGSGSGLTNLPATNLAGIVSDGNLPSDVPRLGLANTFTSPQNVNVPQGVSTGNAFSASNSIGGGVFGVGMTGVEGDGTSVGVLGRGSLIGVFGATYSNDATFAAGLFTNYASGNAGNILLGQSAGVTKFSVDGKGDVAASGSVTIGGGTAITEHLSIQVSPTFAALKVGTCTTANFTLTGAADGDTVALGVPNSMMTVAGIPNYSAWVSAANTITVRECNLDPNINQKAGATGTIRVDLWKH